MINYRIVLRVIGVLLLIIAGLQLVPLSFSLSYGEDYSHFVYSGGLFVVLGAVLFVLGEGSPNIGKREGYLIVASGWLCLCLCGTLPYLFSGVIETLSSAIFESASGTTTTGASVFNDIEALPRGILVWRSLTQWVGGMGIIVLTVALFPLLGIGGVELFVAEAPGPTSDKLHPRIKETAKRLWLIYLGLTGIVYLTLQFVGGMSFFDAFNHALTTVSTGGFSPMNASIAAYPSGWVQYPLILFMFVAGMNYTVIYYSLKGRFDRVWASSEFKAYGLLVGGSTLVIGLSVYLSGDLPFEQAFRDAAFQIVSLITTTGFVSADYTAWGEVFALFFFLLLFCGACAGSTSGGIKIIRHAVFFRNSLLEFKRLLHPRAMVRTKIDGKVVAGTTITHVSVFLYVYLLLFIIGSLIMIVVLRDFEQPFLTAIGAVATSLGNVGPAIGEVGPVNNFSAIPEGGKVFLSFLMIVGRLELFTFLVLFTPYFWRTN